MGTWTLESVDGNTSNHDTDELFGLNVRVTFRLVYRRTAIGSFTETPTLDWHERFVMKEHHRGEWWEFESNMYAHNPNSRTLEIWPRRYIEAYRHATGLPADPLRKGSVQLLAVAGAPVPADAIAAGIDDEEGQAEAVRNYLKSSGGTLVIMIHDVPSINRPAFGEHCERMLVLDCGIVGGGPRFRGVQYLDLDGSAEPETWTRIFQSEAMGDLGTVGLTKVEPPEIVATARVPVFAAGEYA